MATFADLPPEMVGNVFAFVRQKADQGTVCLVSRSWRSIMAPMMWEKLRTTFGESDDRSLVTLLDPDSGILPHVRELEICGTWMKDLEDHLRLLITALPRDRLRKVNCDDKMTNSTFQQLLLSQRKLDSIDVDTEITTLGGATDSHFLSHNFRAWTASLMAGVKQATLYFGLKEGNAKETFENLRKAFGAYPDLKSLTLSFTMVFPDSLEDILSYATEGQLFFNLTTVALLLLPLVPDGSQPFCHNLDVTKLQHLELTECDFIVPFLDSLSDSYSEMSGVLRILSIKLPFDIPEPVETITSIERLLKVCPKLEDLLLELGKCDLVDKNCLLSHADTLRSLLVGTVSAEEPMYFSRHDLGIILKACTKVKWLAINLPPVDLGAITELGRNFRLNGNDESLTEFEGLLAEISGHSTLHPLRMLSLPNLVSAQDLDGYRNPFTVKGSILPSCDTAMQNFANQIVRYMAHQGTALRIFHVEAIAMYGSLDYPLNREEYRWPHYTYTRGRIQDGLGMDVAVAVPLENALIEFPDNFILQNSNFELW